MRRAFAEELEKMMEDRNTFLLTGDLGFSVFERIKGRFTTQYVNMGVAEQNMLGVAAGMALTGKRVFVYSIIPFIVFRPFEQLRNDICFQNVPVRLVGVGAGFSYSDAGFTHHAIEDYGLLNSLPNLTILSPADPLEVSEQMKQIDNIKGPTYMRLSRNGEPVLHTNHKELKIGKALEISHGDDVLFLATGTILGKAIKIAKLLEKDGYSVSILDYHTIKPFDEESLLKSSANKVLIVTFEEHLVNTGLYSMVAQSLMSNHIYLRVLKFGISEPYTEVSGTRDYMLSKYGLDDQEMYKKIKITLKEGKL